MRFCARHEDAGFDNWQVLGDGPGEGAWCWVLGAWGEGAEAEVEPRAAGGEEGEVNGQAPNGRDARWPSRRVCLC